jgi:predicted esterase
LAADNSIHEGQPVVQAGVPLARARAVVVFIHGRGASAHDVHALASAFGQDDVGYIAPQAALISGAPQWYPYRFSEPLARNEPFLTSALRAVDGLITRLEGQGIRPERIALMGFSQGACVTLEYAARHARRYGLVAGFSGGLIGPLGMARSDSGSLAGTPVFLGCSDIDAHIPLAKVEEAAQTMAALGAVVEKRIYPDMGHTINDDEIDYVGRLLAGM